MRDGGKNIEAGRILERVFEMLLYRGVPDLNEGGREERAEPDPCQMYPNNGGKTITTMTAHTAYTGR